MAKNNKSIVLNDLSDLRNMDKIKKQAAQSASDLRQFAVRLSRLSHDFMDIANDEIKDARKQVTTRIKKDPLKATATAFVAGFLIRSIFWR